MNKTELARQFQTICYLRPAGLVDVSRHVQLLRELDVGVELLLAAGVHVEDEAVELEVEDGRQVQQPDATSGVLRRYGHYQVGK